MMGVGQGVGNSSHHSDIVGVASSVGIVDREAVSHLVRGVGVSISLSLAIVDSMVNSRDGSVGVDSRGIGVGVDTVANSGDNSDIVGVASGVGIVDREAGSNLVGGVGLGISLSLPLAIVGSVVQGRDSGVGVHSRSMGVHSSVSDGADSRDQAVAIVDSSDDTAIGVTMGNLANGVGVTAGAGNEGKNL